MTIVYIGMFMSLWTIGTTLILNHHKNQFTYWMGTLIFIAGFESFSVVINQILLPFLRKQGTVSPALIEWIRIMTIAIWGMEYHLLPYLFLMSSIIFTEHFSHKVHILYSCLLLIPIIAYAVIIPSYYPEAVFGGTMFKIISGAYFFTGVLVYFISYFKEKNPVYRSNRFRTILAVFAITYLYASDYLGINFIQIRKNNLVISSNNLWHFNFLIVIWLVLFFIYFGLKYGFLGIKLRIQQQKLDFSSSSLTDGTIILNHSLKNEVQKINYLSKKIKNSIQMNHKDEILQDISSILNITNHMLDMVTRIRENADKIILKEQPIHLGKLLDLEILTFSTILQEKEILLNKDYQIDPMVFCDPTHIKETFSNICMNAIESMVPGKGYLEIIMAEHKRDAVIWIKDNGSGISKENYLKVFDPFFTTKKGSHHYGLGLTYCYNVMKKHGGTLQIMNSEEGQGTLMEMRFPRKRVLHMLLDGKKTPLSKDNKISNSDYL